MNRSRLLFFVLICLIIFIYVRYYMTYKNDYNILQTYLNRIDLNVLYEKYPVVIYDRIQDPKQLLKTLFAYSYMFQKGPSPVPEGSLLVNKSKYAVLFSPKSDVDIHLINPKYTSRTVSKKTLDQVDADVQYITIKLKNNQVLILPTHWIYQSNAPIISIFLDDALSFITSFF